MAIGGLQETRYTVTIKFFSHSADHKNVQNSKTATTWLPKPVLDRIRRYAKEGRQPLVRYGQPDCLLLAVAMGQNPVVILRSSREQFTELRSAALIEWVRVARRATPRPGQPPFTRYNT